MNEPWASSPCQAEISTILDVLALASVGILEIYADADTGEITKADGSPVTAADLAADRIIREGLRSRFPDDALLTEEGEDPTTRLAAKRCWIVDPIDGTQQFLERTDQFDILVALVDTETGRPLVGASCQPTTGLICLAVAGQGAWVRARSGAAFEHFGLTDSPRSTPRVGTATWFGSPGNEELLARTTAELHGEVVPVSVIGFTPRIWLGERTQDVLLGVRNGDNQTMAWYWDFAVGDLFLHEAGGAITTLGGQKLRYNLSPPRLHDGFVAAVNPDLQQQAQHGILSVLAASGKRLEEPQP